MVTNFTDLNTWKESHKLVLLTYKTLEKFPQKEKQQFYYISKGSLTELENHFLIARDVKYIDMFIFNNLNQQIEVVGRLLTGLIRSAV